jgi:aminoglycoside 6-adenylyltransferase
MRNSTEIYSLLEKITWQDNRILALYMNGSRVNPNVMQDDFQDYDVVFVVTETSSFINDKNWINNFGKPYYFQLPDENPNFPNDKENFYGYLVQFDDGVRMDIHIETLSHALENIKNDSLCKILIDKNNYLPKIPESSDKDYWVKRPSQEQFLACCNEFWWCTNNLAKGLARKEILYVQDMANFVVRKELEKMLSWKVGIKTDFKVSVGKSAKYFSKYLDKEIYENYLKTFFTCDIESAWKSIFLMCDLFEKISVEMANKLGYSYNFKEAKNARKFLERVRKL